jgi:glucosamine-6-phosphate deaminase
MVHDGCFARIEEVPRHAYTMTVPACLGGAATVVIVPTELKAPAIKAVLEGPVTTEVPASILRTKENAWLLLDRDSASLLEANLYDADREDAYGVIFLLHSHKIHSRLALNGKVEPS